MIPVRPKMALRSSDFEKYFLGFWRASEVCCGSRRTQLFFKQAKKYYFTKLACENEIPRKQILIFFGFQTGSKALLIFRF